MQTPSSPLRLHLLVFAFLMVPACAPATSSTVDADAAIPRDVREEAQVRGEREADLPSRNGGNDDAAPDSAALEATEAEAMGSMGAPWAAAPVEAVAAPAMPAPLHTEPGSSSALELPGVPLVAAFAVPEPALPIDWREEGVASWYGPNFVGRPTANGEIFDPSRLTAAHQTLPFGTRIRVTNLENGRVVVVRINDRGPFISGRIIDLARGAAEVIGIVATGTARVQLEVAGGPAGERPVRVDRRLAGYDVIVPGAAPGTLLVLTTPAGADIVVRAVPLVAPAVPGVDGEAVWMSGALATRVGAIVTVQAP